MLCMPPGCLHCQRPQCRQDGQQSCKVHGPHTTHLCCMQARPIQAQCLGGRQPHSGALACMGSRRHTTPYRPYNLSNRPYNLSNSTARAKQPHTRCHTAAASAPDTRDTRPRRTRPRQLRAWQAASGSILLLVLALPAPDAEARRPALSCGRAGASAAEAALGSLRSTASICSMGGSCPDAAASQARVCGKRWPSCSGLQPWALPSISSNLVVA